MSERPTLLAVCGKGGVGKTAVSALLARALRARGVGPLLLIDADPVGGLVHAMGQGASRTLAQVRAGVIRAARGSTEADRQQLADELDYRVMEALTEHEDYALLAMGRSRDPGCFCPVNTLLRHAIETLATPFAVVLVDAEAGVEQIQREVTRRVTRTLVVVDGSARSLHTLEAIGELVAPGTVAVVANRWTPSQPPPLPADVTFLGRIPEDETLRDFDRQGRPLWELPAENPALAAAADLAAALEVDP